MAARAAAGVAKHAGCHLYFCHRDVLRGFHSLRERLRIAQKGQFMSASNILLLLVCAAICGYLLYALLRAEDF